MYLLNGCFIATGPECLKTSPGTGSPSVHASCLPRDLHWGGGDFKGEMRFGDLSWLGITFLEPGGSVAAPPSPAGSASASWWPSTTRGGSFSPFPPF